MPKTRADKRKQSQLTFSPLPSSSSARASQPEAVRHRVAAITLDMPTVSSKKRKLDDYYIPTPTQSFQFDMSQTKLLSSPSTQYRTRNFMASSSAEPTKVTRKRVQSLHSLSDSDAEVGDQGGEGGATSSSEDESSIQQTEHITAADHSDELPDLTSARQNANRLQRGRKTITVDSDDGDVVSSPRRAHKKVKVVEISDGDEDTKDKEAPKPESDDDDEDEPPVSTRRRRLRRAPATEDSSPVRVTKTRTREELDEDLDFLNDSDSYAARPSQTPNKQTAKQKALEALRRKRSEQSGKMSTNTTASRAIVLSDSEVEEQEQEEESDADNDAVVSSILKSTTHAKDDNDEEDDFVVSDDPDSPSSHAVSLPMQFSRYATMKPVELFKYAVEWLVQKKINPAFAMSDDVYRMAFRRLDDFVKGMGGSKFQSSVWQARFSGELLGRPNLEEKRQSSEVIMHGCDACNRTNHPATFEVRFTGAKYDKETLEEDSEDKGDEDDSSSSESEDADSDDDEAVTSSVRRRRKSKKNKGAPASRTFYLGKFCMANARTLHTLTHWRYHLNEWVIDHMASSGYLTPALIVERDGWSTKKRRKYANSIVDSMEEEGEVRKLYRDFKREVSTAQRSNEGRYSDRMVSP